MKVIIKEDLTKLKSFSVAAKGHVVILEFEQLLEYEIASTSLIGSFWWRVFPRLHIKLVRVKYNRYVEFKKLMK